MSRKMMMMAAAFAAAMSLMADTETMWTYRINCGTAENMV